MSSVSIPLEFVDHAAEGQSAGVLSRATTSFTPLVGDLLIAPWVAHDVTVEIVHTLVSNSGFTVDKWRTVISPSLVNGTDNQRSGFSWGIVTASAAGQVTHTFSQSCDVIRVAAYSYRGSYDRDNPIRQTVFASNSPGTGSISALFSSGALGKSPRINSELLSMFYGTTEGATTTPATGWTELFEYVANTQPMSIHRATGANGDGFGGTFSVTMTNGPGAFALEIQMAGGITENNGKDVVLDTAGNSIAAKIEFAALVQKDINGAWVLKDVVSGEQITPPAGWGIKQDAVHGFVIDFDASQSSIASFDYTKLGKGRTGITLGTEVQYMALFRDPNATIAANQQIWSSVGTGNDALNWFARTGPTAGVNLTLEIQSVGTGPSMVETPTWSNWNVAGVSRDNPLGQRTYLNGVASARNTTTTGSPNAIAHPIYIGSGESGSYYNGEAGLFVIATTELTDVENASFADDPWQIFVQTPVTRNTGAPLEIDTDNDMGASLQFMGIVEGAAEGRAVVRDLVSGQYTTIQGIGGWATTLDPQHGYVADISLSGFTSRSFVETTLGRLGTGIIIGDEVTALFFGKSSVADATQNHIPMASRDGTVATRALDTFVRGSDDQWFWSWRTPTGTDVQSVPITGAQWQTWQMLGGQRELATGSRYVRNDIVGAWDTTLTDDPIDEDGSGGNKLYVGGRQVDQDPWQGQAGIWMIFDRTLTEAELDSLYANPWQLTRPVQTPVRNEGQSYIVNKDNAIGAKVAFAAAIDYTDPANPKLKDFVSGETIAISSVTGWSTTYDPEQGYMLDIDIASDPVGFFTYTNLGRARAGIAFGTEVQYHTVVKSNVADVTSNDNIMQSSGAGNDALAALTRGPSEAFVSGIPVGAANGDNPNRTIADWTIWHSLGSSRDSALGIRIIWDGTEDAYLNSVVGNPNDIAHNIAIGNINAGGQAWDGQISLLVIFDSELTTQENSDFADNPWQILKPATRNDGVRYRLSTTNPMASKVQFLAVLDQPRGNLLDLVSGETIPLSFHAAITEAFDAYNGYVMAIDGASMTGNAPFFESTVLGRLRESISFVNEAQYAAVVKGISGTPGTNYRFFMAPGSGTDPFTMMRLTSNNFQASIYGQTGVDTTDSAEGDTWANWKNLSVAKITGGGQRLVVNGVMQALDEGNVEAPRDLTNDAYVGGWDAASQYWRGQIAMLAIFDETLTEEENESFNFDPWQLVEEATMWQRSSHRSIGNGATGTANIGTVAEGDGMSMLVMLENDASAYTMSTPTGWALQASHVGDPFQASAYLFTKIAGASEGNVALTFSGTCGYTVILDSVAGVAGLRTAAMSAYNNSATSVSSPAVAALEGDFIIEEAIIIGFDGTGLDLQIPQANDELQIPITGAAQSNADNAESAYVRSLVGQHAPATWTHDGSAQKVIAATVVWQSTLVPVLNIDSVTPTVIRDGLTLVTIVGTEFGVTQGQVLVGGRAQTITQWTDTQIQFTAERAQDNLGATTLEVRKPL